MSKQNKIIWRTLAVLVIALLVSLCFLGSTFARYTSEASGNGGVAVSYWHFTSTSGYSSTSTATITPSKAACTIVSPSISADTSKTTGYALTDARSNTSDPLLSLVVVNDGDVDGYLDNSSWTKDYNFEFYDKQADPQAITDFSAVATTLDSLIIATSKSAKEILQYMFDYTLYVEVKVTSGATAPSGWVYKETASRGDGYDYYYIKLSEATQDQLTMEADGGTLNIYASVTWTSDIAIDGTNALYGDTADAVDTWIGQNVGHIEFTVTMNAVQASDHPGTDSSYTKS